MTEAKKSPGDMKDFVANLMQKDEMISVGVF
jgi:hypothetical protein